MAALAELEGGPKEEEEEPEKKEEEKEEEIEEYIEPKTPGRDKTSSPSCTLYKLLQETPVQSGRHWERNVVSANRQGCLIT